MTGRDERALHSSAERGFALRRTRTSLLNVITTNLASEGRLLFLDRRLEPRPAMDPVEVGDQLRPSLRIDAVSRQHEIHKLGCDADIRDAELVADQEFVVAELAFQVVEHRGKIGIDDLLDLGEVRLLLEKAPRNYFRKEKFVLV